MTGIADVIDTDRDSAPHRDGPPATSPGAWILAITTAR